MSEADAAALDSPPPDDAQDGSWWLVLAVAVGAGALTGLVGGAFRWLLAHADLNRDKLLHWARIDGAWRWTIPIIAAFAAVALARLIVRYFPQVSGSGVQRVEALLRAELDLPPLVLVPAKFVGGLLSLGAGMALGREGPTVQMGATIGSTIAKRVRLGPHDIRTLATAAAGAGLGVAFSAPLGGALFVFEEVAHAFRTRLVLATLTTCATALLVSQWFVGTHSIFTVGRLSAPRLAQMPAYIVLGVILGGLGVVYNRFVVRLLDLAAKLPAIPPEAKAGLVGALIAIIGLLNPSMIGGGDGLTQRILVGNVAMWSLVGIACLRWLLGPVSYSVGTPGGLFAPLLVVGAAVGGLFGHSTFALSHLLGLNTTSAAIVGMVAFFAAVVRAPITGLVLIMEMTATTTLVIPMAVAAAAAVLTATLLRGVPIYDTLRARLSDRAIAAA